VIRQLTWPPAGWAFFCVAHRRPASPAADTSSFLRCHGFFPLAVAGPSHVFPTNIGYSPRTPLLTNETQLKKKPAKEEAPWTGECYSEG